MVSHVTTAPEGEGDDEDYGDYASSREVPMADKDALNITAQSANLQLDILANVASSLQTEKSKNPGLSLADSAVDQALAAYEAAVSSLQGLVQNLLKISRDRDAYWQYRLNREAHLRKMWEESMARVAQEHEELQSKMGESEEKRRRTKRALKEALEISSATTGFAISKAPSRMASTGEEGDGADERMEAHAPGADNLSQADEQEAGRPLRRKKSTLSQISDLCDSASDSEDEFFDAIDSGEIEVENLAHTEASTEKDKSMGEGTELRAIKRLEIAPSFKGYEESIRNKLKMDYDNRPKISLWVSGDLITTKLVSNGQRFTYYYQLRLF